MTRDDRRSSEAQEYRRLYGTARWKATRARQLAEKPLCESCQRRGRVVPATVCNHADPASKASEATFFDGPFTSLCAPCHDQGEQREEKAGYSFTVGADGWPTDDRHPANTGRIDTSPPIGNAKTHPVWFREALIPTTLVCGPPGSGKSTLVRERAGPSDRVVCFDLVARDMFGGGRGQRVHAGLTPDQVGDVLRARNEQIADLMWAKARSRWSRAWIIVSEARAEYRQWWVDRLGCSVVVLETPADECIRRVRADRQRGDVRHQETERVIRKWWSQYQPREGDEQVRP